LIYEIKNTAKKLLLHPLFSGSFVMIAGSNIVNVIAYIYHLVMGRLLGPSEYASLAVTLSILSLFTAAFGFLGTVIVKFISISDEDKQNAIYSWFFKRILILAGVLAAVLLIAAPVIADYLKISRSITYLVGPSVFIFAISMAQRSFLQGLLKFTKSVILGITDLGGRLLIGLTLVYVGWAAYGAVFGILLGIIVSALFGYFFLRQFSLTGSELFTKGREVFKYALPVSLATIASTSFFTTDVLLVKHFFNAHDAGIYAALSMLGKIIFYGASPVAAVMFPLISRRHSRSEGYVKILALSILLTAWISSVVLFIYWLLPELAINILYGSDYLEAVPYLVWYGLFISVYTLANLISSFYLSVNKTRVALIVLFFALAQAIGIYNYHNSVSQVITVSLISVSLLLISLLLYFFRSRHSMSHR
jgi:O-antigen/teichoic acid export membrane protein